MSDVISESDDDFVRGGNGQAEYGQAENVDYREQGRQEPETRSGPTQEAPDQVTRSGREVRLPAWRKDYD